MQPFSRSFNGPDGKRLAKKLPLGAGSAGGTVRGGGLEGFVRFCEVDLHLSKSTIDRNRCLMGHIVRGCGPDPSAGIFWAKSKAPFTAIITLRP